MLVKGSSRKGRGVTAASLKGAVLTVALVSLFSTALVHADESAQIELPAVTIIGTTPLPGIGLSKSQIPASVQTATDADIDRSMALDLSAFMNRNLGSVNINETQGNPFQPDVNYRGYTASPLLGTPQGLSVYMDGVRLNQPFGDVVSWDLIPRAAISSVTLMSGSNPLFGLNTLGGALSLKTKDGLSNPGSSIQAIAGSNGRYSTEFEHGGYNDKGLNWYMTGNVFREDGWRESSPSRVNQLFGKLGWSDQRTELALTASYAGNKLTGNGLQEQRFLAQSYSSVYTKPDETKNDALFLNLTGKFNLDDETLLAGNVYYRKIRTSTFNGDMNDRSLDQSVYQPTAAEQTALTTAGYTGFPAAGADASNTPFLYWRCIANVLLNTDPAKYCNGLINRTKTEQENFGFSGQLTLLGTLAGLPNQFTSGAGFDASKADFKQTSQFGYINPDRSITAVNFFADGTELDDNGNPIDSRVDLTGRTRTWSIFATDTVSIHDVLHLTVSGRYNRTSVKNQDHLNPGGGSGSLDGDYVYSRFNPAIGMAFAPTQTFSTYVGYNEGSRTPSAIELGCADPANPCKLPNAMAGDPPLKQVVTKTWEAGLRGALSANTTWNASLFRSENFDDILFVASSQSGSGYFKNFGKTRRQGLELGLESRIGKLDVGANYTYLDATYQSRETVGAAGNSSSDASSPGLDGNIVINPGNRIPLIPQHTLKLRADYQVNWAWSLGLGMTAVSSAYARGNENNQHQPDGTNYLGSGKSAGYSVFDLSSRYRASSQLSFFGMVNNLFDRKYATAAQLGTTGFGANGGFVAQPFAAVGGEYPLVRATFYSPGASRTIWIGMRYEFDKPAVN
ncbi:MAG TPA: TonB-dependent receptor [Rhodocyclaceae bacterium]